MLRTLSTLFLCLAAGALPAHAAEPGLDEHGRASALLSALTPQQGKVTLPGKIATLDLPDRFRYLDPKDTARVLTEGWGNPPADPTLGMIIPADGSVLDQHGWGVVITYDQDGHVKDDEADSIKYDQLLKDMQEGVEDDNGERKRAGYAPMHLLGWAEPPHYDKIAHKLYWAKKLATDGSAENSLNYNIRVLGREGVLVLNGVAAMSDLPMVREEMKMVTAVTDFTPGNRYTDFNASTDKLAGYGLAALIAGGAAAKLGLFGKLFALLIAFKKIIVVGVLGGASWIWQRLRGRKDAPKVDLSKRG